jgi:hypothetical protein
LFPRTWFRWCCCSSDSSGLGSFFCFLWFPLLFSGMKLPVCWFGSGCFLSPRWFSFSLAVFFCFILCARSVRFHRCYPVTRSAAASAVVLRSDCHNRRSRRYSLTGAWPARTGNLVPGLAREGCASLLRPSLWLFGGGPWWLGVAGVSGYGACVARADSGSDWPFPAMAVEFFVWIVYSLSFHSVSLQWANIVWAFRWL